MSQEKSRIQLVISAVTTIGSLQEFYFKSANIYTYPRISTEYAFLCAINNTNLESVSNLSVLPKYPQTGDETT